VAQEGMRARFLQPQDQIAQKRRMPAILVLLQQSRRVFEGEEVED
jgi:hypothetical protein